MQKNALIIGIVVVVLVVAGVYMAYRPSEEPSLTNTDTTNTDTTGPVTSPAPTNTDPQPNTTSAATVTSGENPRPGDSVHNLPAEPAAVAARAHLAAKLGISAGTITIMSVKPETWNDGCLGLGGPAESCMQMLVDGFRVELLASGKTYIYRTDKTGSNLRAEQ
jgi:hypothetical protein